MGVGGLLALAVPPFHDIARGYYKSSGGVFLFCALVGGGGTIYLRVTRGVDAVSTTEAIAWAIFLLLFSGYLATLWGEAEKARARLFTSSLLAGMVSLAMSAAAVTAGDSVFLDFVGILNVLAGAAALGAVTSGMLIGHWYLIDPGMEIEPFHRCFRFFVGALICETILIIAVLAVVGFGSGELVQNANNYWSLAGLRFALGPVAALGLAFLIARVLAIPQTMAATGLFYIATLAVLVGNFLGRYFTFRTGLPL